MSISNTIIASEPALRRLCENLARWAFTDFDRARGAMREMADQINPRTPFDLRLSFHHSASFLENQWQHTDQAIDHAHKAIGILENLSNDSLLVETWADLAAIYLNERQWQMAQECLDTARSYLTEPSEPRLKAHIDCREGFLNLHLGNTNDALESFLRSADLLRGMGSAASLKDRYIQTLVLSGLGDLYERVGEHQKSMESFRSVVPIVEKHHLRPRLAWHYLNAGRTAYASGEHDAAKENYEKVLSFAIEGDEEARTHALGNLGILAMMEGDFQRAQTLFNQAEAQYLNPVKPSDFVNLSKIQTLCAGLQTHLGNYTEARILLEAAFEIGLNGLDQLHLEQVCTALAKVFNELDDFQKAYQWQVRATEYSAAHFKQLRNRDREEIEARHQLERSRQEAQMARLRVSGLQLRALRAQMNPHFMFNSLNAIQGLITSGRNNEAETYLAKFAQMMRHTLDYSDLEVVTLEQEIEFLDRYLEINRKLRFRERLDFQFIVSPELDGGDVEVPTMILQPFIENAIEHGIRPRQAGNIKIEFLPGPDEYSVLCIIEDDGIGYNKGKEKLSFAPEFQTHRSRGMEITGERLNLLHQLHRKTSDQFVLIQDLSDLTQGKQTGTRVEVLLPILEE